MPSNVDLATELGSPKSMTFRHHQAAVQRRSSVSQRPSSVGPRPSGSANHLPLPATSPGEIGEKSEKVEFDLPPPPRSSNTAHSANGRRPKESLSESDGFLLPARNPPR